MMTPPKRYAARPSAEDNARNKGFERFGEKLKGVESVCWSKRPQCTPALLANHNALLHEINVLAVCSWFYSAFCCVITHLFANVWSDLFFKNWKLSSQSFSKISANLSSQADIDFN
jgi:hypothetical protein